MSEEEIITIDGPASSGKSSVGGEFAKKIGYDCIDSGAIFRAGSLQTLSKQITLSETEKILEIFNSLKLDFKTIAGQHRILLDGEDVTEKLHEQAVTKVVPEIAAIVQVREIAKRLQRSLAKGRKLVMMGRDIGSEIFPHARLKFYLTASAEVRARRRFDQLKRRNPNLTFEQVLEETYDRDLKDATREASPMRIPHGAIIIDTSKLSIEESVKEMLKAYDKVVNLKS